MSDKYREYAENYGETRAELEREESIYGEEEFCPECGSDSFRTRSYLEGQDADGNRGVWVTVTECRKCGEEW